MSRRKNKQNHAKYFPVTSFSALEDYLKNAPSMVRSIKYREDAYERVMGLSQQFSLSIDLEKSYALETALEAKVEIPLYSQSDLYDDIEASRLLILDHVEDPRNFGAIVRTAAYYSVEWIVVPQDRQVVLSPASVSTAQAGFSKTKICCIKNVARFVRDVKSRSFWVCGLVQDGVAFDQSAHLSERIALVLGSEAKGVSKNVRSECDYLVRCGPSEAGLESLNVSVACGIAIDKFFS